MRNKIIEQASQLFFEKGYGAVSLKSICAPLDIKPSSLYYHFAGGKEELYLEIIQKSTDDFRAKIESLAFQHDNLEKILKEFGYWYVNQLPMNMMLIAQIDLPYLSVKGQSAVKAFVGKNIFGALEQLFAKHKLSLREDYKTDLFVGTICVLFFSIHSTLKMSPYGAKELVNYNVNVFIHGSRRSRLEK